jgi:hypothetical protein
MKISNKIYHFYEVPQKQICNVHMFTYHAVVLPASNSTTAHHPASNRCHYSSLAEYVFLLQYMYPKSFTHQSAMLSRKTSMQELGKNGLGFLQFQTPVFNGFFPGVRFP